MNRNLRVKTRHFNPQTNRGATLVVGLIMLVVLTMLSLSAMQSATLQERMSGNMRDYNQAFQSAENAIREAEVAVKGGVYLSDDCTLGRCEDPKNPLTYTWSDATKYSSVAVTMHDGSGNALSTPGRYVLSRYRPPGADYVSCPSTLGQSLGMQKGAGSDTCPTYTALVIGYGVRSDSQVLLEEVMQRVGTLK